MTKLNTHGNFTKNSTCMMNKNDALLVNKCNIINNIINMKIFAANNSFLEINPLERLNLHMWKKGNFLFVKNGFSACSWLI